MIMMGALRVAEIRTAVMKFNSSIPEAKRGDELTRRHTATLRKASLWWATADMTALALAAAHTLPEWTPEIARPEPTGFMVFQGPIGQTPDNERPGFTPDGHSADSILSGGRVYAVHWSIQDDYLILTLYGRVSSATQRARTKPVWEDLYEIGIYSTIASHAFHPSRKEFGEQHIHEMLHVLGAAWLLMQQPTVADVTRRKARQRGKLKRGMKKFSPVQVIDLRRLAHKPDTTSGGDSEREYSHRWMVRGHWRQQRVGPGRASVRPVFVPPHIKGPDGAPLKTERVHVWRR